MLNDLSIAFASSSARRGEPISPVPISEGLNGAYPLTISDAIWLFPLVFAVSFLLGSIPWGVIISKFAYQTDIRKSGSGNIGATNAMRTLGKVGGASVFILDFAKGLLSGYIGYAACSLMYLDSPWLSKVPLALAFIGCIWGHIFSPWLGFRGGKGVAVAVGALIFVFGPIGTLIELVAFIIVVAITRYVSAGSITAAVICPFIALWLGFGSWTYVIICTLAAITVIWAHRANLSRLIHGQESKIGSSKEKK